MTCLVIVGGIVGAWAALNVLCGERQRRVQQAELQAILRRQAADRAAAEAARKKAKEASAAASAAARPGSN